MNEWMNELPLQDQQILEDSQSFASRIQKDFRKSHWCPMIWPGTIVSSFWHWHVVTRSTLTCMSCEPILGWNAGTHTLSSAVGIGPQSLSILVWFSTWNNLRGFFNIKSRVAAGNVLLKARCQVFAQFFDVDGKTVATFRRRGRRYLADDGWSKKIKL